MRYDIICLSLFILLILLIILYICNYRNLRKERKEKEEIIDNKNLEFNNYWEERNNKLEEEYNHNKEILEKEYTLNVNRLNEQLASIYQSNIDRRAELETQLKNEIAQKETKEKINLQNKIKYLQSQEELNLQKELNLARELNYKEIEELVEKKKQYEDAAAEAADEYCDILNVLDDFRARREVVNQQVLREKQLQENTDFYRICLSENDIEDLQVIKDIEHKFNNKEVLRKAAFDCYVRRPLSEMEKRVLGNKKPSGIYIITYIPTGEIYIGRSTDISNRWVEHVKSAFNLGTIAHSSLHTKMEEKGIWNFTFQILEEVPKEKLSEREKYWINVYGATSLLNQKQGG